MAQAALHSVRGRSGRAVHLVVTVPDGGSVTTLCGRPLPADAIRPVAGEATCALCLRGRQDQTLISSRLFEAGLGANLLELSLEQARNRRRHDHGLKVVPPAAAPPPPPPPKPPKVNGLDLARLRRLSEGVYVDDAGLIVRLRQEGGGWRVAGIETPGPVRLTRGRSGWHLSGEGLEAGLD